VPKRSAHHSSRWKAYALLLINTLIWGAALIVVKPALDTTTPFRYLWYRYVLAAVISLPILVHYLPRWKKLRTSLPTIIWMELLGTTFSLGLLYTGLDHTTAIEASLIATTTPLFTTLGGMWLLKEKQTRHEWFGLSLAFAGTVWLTLIPLLNTTTRLEGFSLMGNLLIVGQNIFTALYFVLAKRRYAQLPKFWVTTISFYVGLITFGLLSFLELRANIPAFMHAIQTDLATPAVWLASGFMALFGSVIALTAYIKGQDGIEASEASWFWYLQPLVYLPLGYFWLHETIHPAQYLALGLILLGVMVAEYRTRRR
jgi:drug/metabolite transporter (DMT)-like permease